MSLAIPYRSIPDMLAQRVAATPDARAFGYPDPDGGVGWMSWAEVGARATTIAAGSARPRASVPRTGSRSCPARGWSGCWPTSAS